MPRTVALFGEAPKAADFALRSVLKLKPDSGSVTVIDATGRGAAILGKSNVKDLLHHPLAWIDLANRQRPVALFQLANSPHLQAVLSGVLCMMRAVARAQISNSTIAWVGGVASRLAQDGTVGLGGLLRSLSDTTARKWFIDSQPDATDLDRLRQLLAWGLRYPAVYAISEGNNRLSMKSELTHKETIWIEALSEHFEEAEHHLVVGLATAAVEDALRCALETNLGSPQQSTPTVLHLFPPNMEGLHFNSWVFDTARSVRHIAAFTLYPDRSLRTNALEWAHKASEVWILATHEKLKSNRHSGWLTGGQLTRLQELDADQMLVRANDTGNTLTVRSKPIEGAVPLAQELRVKAAQHRKPAPVRQMSAALSMFAQKPGVHADLYPQLANRELLRLGWLKVQHGKRDSCGVDRVTYRMFKENLEQELKSLAEELLSRSYRCRPLKRVYLSKSDGTQRPIGVCCVRDQVVQATCLLLMEPIFEPLFSQYSFAFRPRRNAHHALAVAQSLIVNGNAWAVTADIRKCFDTIDHQVLLDQLACQIGDPALLDLIYHWMSVNIFDFSELLPNDLGVPQGAVLSPLLSNIYLDSLDEHFEHLELNFVRYADDILLFTTSEEAAKNALHRLEEFLHDPLHLELKPTRKNYLPVAEGVDFLGFRLKSSGIEVLDPKLDKAQAVLRGEVERLGQKNASFLDRVDALNRISSFIRGFRNYFRLPGEPEIEKQMNLLDQCVDELGRQFLPVQLLDDPGWICRERFSFDHNLESDSSASQERQKRPPIHDEYPQAKELNPPTDEMAKSKEELDQMILVRKPSIVIEDPGEDETESEGSVTPQGIVQHSGRLYVLIHGSYLALADEDLVIKKRKVEISRHRLEEVGLLFLQGLGMNISVGLQLRLAELDIPVVFAPPIGPPMAILNPIRSTRSFLRSQQVLRRNDPDVIKSGLSMLAAKVGNQAAVLNYFAKYRKKTNAPVAVQLMETADQILGLARQLTALDPSGADIRPAAMGFEGHAAALYWKNLIQVAPNRNGFPGRVTQTAGDPINQSINYVYGMLYGEVWRAIVKTGLDPYFGLMHGAQRDQGSLVFDLIEEFRAPFADRFVFGMLGRGFKPEINPKGLLTTRTRVLLARGFSTSWTKKIHWRSETIQPAVLLEHQAGELVRLFNGEREYRPYRMKW